MNINHEWLIEMGNEIDKMESEIEKWQDMKNSSLINYTREFAVKCLGEVFLDDEGVQLKVIGFKIYPEPLILAISEGERYCEIPITKIWKRKDSGNEKNNRVQY